MSFSTHVWIALHAVTVSTSLNSAHYGLIWEQYPVWIQRSLSMRMMFTRLWSWHQDVVQGTIERKNGTIYLLDQQRIPLMWWDFMEAYPGKWSGPQLQADSNTVAVETTNSPNGNCTKRSAK